MATTRSSKRVRGEEPLMDYDDYPVVKKEKLVMPEVDDIENSQLEEFSEEDEEDEVEEETEMVIAEEDCNGATEFSKKVKRMCELEDEIKKINASKKVLTDEKNSLCKEVMCYMADKSVSEVNYGANEILYLDTRESAGSLTRKKLLEAIKKYHEVGDVKVKKEECATLDAEIVDNLADAEAMYQFIEETLGKNTKVVLVREAKNKKKRNRKPAARLSVYNK